MKKNKEMRGRLIHLIAMNGKLVDKKGVIRYMDQEGNYFVRWDDGTKGYAYSRGCVYRLSDIPQKKVIEIKNLFISLLNKIKNLYYGN